MTAPIHGGFTYDQMQDLLNRACTAVGLDATDAELMRGQTNAVIRLASEPVVVKIARNGTNLQEVHRTVRFVRWLMDLGFPTVPLYRPEAQPLVIDGHPVTLWTYLPQPRYPVPAGAIAKPLNVLHSLSQPPVALDPLNVCAAIRHSLDSITTLRQDELDFLNNRVGSLQQALTGVTYELESAVLQGDPQHGNALHDGERAVLCDWDSVAFGQPEWDLVTIEVHCRRFGYGTRHYNQFAEAYGWDVTQWPGYPVLRDLRELRMITTNASKATHEPAKLSEVQRRIDGLRCGDLGQRWNIL
ncbi:phosphotransferase [Streptantibioticus ferralitis]|uniref:Aminoglycoside phosphotransferase family protein n=1 Tax=Streptantibioticus ferralitis TaxID=236510 RepID=A0ABT5Z1G4_9ACTN|nr:phosphotransferase [Streptantibioticus ferralitis]MDF2257666.1 aminoglycoside phosphotransferase family protein [Streptantibioticus ferralitis]